MKLSRTLWSAIVLITLTVAVNAQRRPMTPEQRAAAEARAQATANAPDPIPVLDTVWIEDMTYMEVRDAIKAGKTTVLVVGGGIEQNGPYLPGGKHDYIAKVTAEPIARKLGNALIAPILVLAPGNPDKIPNPGSIFLTDETFKAMLTDIAKSLKSQGFKNILFMADHGEDQKQMSEVVKALGDQWSGSGTGIYYVPEYYNNEALRKFIADQGVKEVSWNSEGIHDEYQITAISMVYDPNSIRLEQRIKAGKTTINGASILPAEKTLEIGKKLIAYRTDFTVAAINKLLSPPHTGQ
jgi:creatinine amidohydrolase